MDDQPLDDVLRRLEVTLFQQIGSASDRAISTRDKQTQPPVTNSYIFRTSWSIRSGPSSA